MNASNLIIPPELIERRIFFLRKNRIMLSSDLAELYGVSVKALNQAVKRNTERFPNDFMFQLTAEEFVGAAPGVPGLMLFLNMGF